MTTLLLDTHALIWALTRSTRLPGRVAAMLADRSNDVCVSAASAYEIEFKRERSPELTGLPADIEAAVQAISFRWIAIEPGDAVLAGRLPKLHGDPFDRLLVAQALRANATLVTRDPWIAPYGVPTFW